MWLNLDTTLTSLDKTSTWGVLGEDVWHNRWLCRSRDLPKCTETDLKKSQICPIWGQSDPIWMQNWRSLLWHWARPGWHFTLHTLHKYLNKHRCLLYKHTSHLRTWSSVVFLYIYFFKNLILIKLGYLARREGRVELLSFIFIRDLIRKRK